MSTGVLVRPEPRVSRQRSSAHEDSVQPGEHTPSERPLVCRPARVSIGLPVHNGECYLDEAIRSILGQTYTRFELVISDNGSTDRTREICERYAREDPRIRYARTSENRGAAWNYRRVFELSNGEYFKWAAHDDILAPGYLESCVETLDADRALIACQSATGTIDALGQSLGSYLSGVGDPDPCERFRRAIHSEYPIELFGLFRAAVLSETRLIASYPQSDIDLLLELVLRGDIGRVSEPLFYRRSHAESYSGSTMCYREKLHWMDPTRRTPYALFCVLRFRRLCANVLRAPLPRSVRLRCLGTLLAHCTRVPFRRLAPTPRSKAADLALAP